MARTKQSIPRSIIAEFYLITTEPVLKVALARLQTEADKMQTEMGKQCYRTSQILLLVYHLRVVQAILGVKNPE